MSPHYGGRMRVWMDGRVLDDPTGPALSVADHGFTVGDGVFEAIKIVDGQPFAVSRHLARLAKSAEGMGLPPVDEAFVREGIAAALEGQDLPMGRMRITYTGGIAPMGSGRGDNPPTVVVAAAPMAQYEASTAIFTVPWPRNERGALAGLKTTSYGENVVALAAAKERGASEAIFANLAGHLCEGTGSNVFYVVDGELRTPPNSWKLLPGTTRSVLEELADRCGVKWRATDVSEAELRGAQEIMLGAATREVQPVTSLDGKQIGDGRPGPVWRKLYDAYQQFKRELAGRPW